MIIQHYSRYGGFRESIVTALEEGAVGEVINQVFGYVQNARLPLEHEKTLSRLFLLVFPLATLIVLLCLCLIPLISISP